MDEFEKQYSLLNQDQKRAVDTIEGPVLVIAGPGTGKTQVLSLRIANILKQTQVDPKSILCLTFQDASVLAMKNRLQKFIGQAAYKVQIHTFHSFCSEIIRTFPHLFDFEQNVEPIRDLDKLEIFREILQSQNLLNLQYRNDVLGNFRGIESAISNLKKEYITPENFALIIDNFEQNLDEKNKKIEERRILKLRELKIFYEKYLEVLKARNFIDFDDMIFRVTDAFSKNDDLVKFFQEQYLYTLVDEFQDTNNAQLEVIKAISSFEGLESNVFAVGDDDQTIFRFQGASSDNFEKFLNIFPQSEIIVLHENYRSKQEIIDASSKVISNNPNRISESLFFSERNLNKDFISKYIPDSSTENNQENNLAVQIHKFEHSFHEDFWIGEKIKALAENGIPLAEIAIISRTNRQITNITKFLDKLSIPYQIKRSESLLDDGYIRDLLLLIEAISSPDILKNDKIVWRLLSLDFWKNNQFDIFGLYHEAKNSKMSIYDFVMQNLQSSDNNLQTENSKSKIQNSKVSVQNSKLSSTSQKSQQLGLFETEKVLDEISHTLPVFPSVTLQENLNDIQDIEMNAKYVDIKETFQKLIELQNFSLNNSFQLTFSKILQTFDLISYFETLDESYAVLNKITSLYQFIQSRTKFLKNYSLDDFQNEIKIMRDKNINLPIDPIDFDADNKINILTAHSAKGLEFKYVFIYQTIENKWEKIRGGNDGISLPPLQLSVNSDQSSGKNLQSSNYKLQSQKTGITNYELRKNVLNDEKIAAETDERRLFYVAATRAKDFLFFTYSKKYYDSDSGEVDTSEKIQSKYVSESEAENVFEHSDLIKRHLEISQIILAPEPPIQIPNQNAEHLKSIITKDLKLSASKVNKYQKCHYKFLLEDIYKIPTPESASLLLGTAVHTGIEKIFNLQSSNFNPEVQSEELEKILLEIKRELSNLIDQTQLEKEGSSKELILRDLENSLRIYYEFAAKNPIKRIASEFWSSGTFEGIKINGRIDMVSNEDFGYVITDFKTAQNIPSITEFLGLTKAGDKSYLRQLLFYRLLLENSDQAQSRKFAGKIKFLKIEYIDLKEKTVKVFELPAGGNFEFKMRSNSKTTTSFDLDEEYDNLKKEIKESYSSILELDFKRTEDRRQCQFCPFKEHCRR